MVATVEEVLVIVAVVVMVLMAVVEKVAVTLSRTCCPLLLAPPRWPSG